MKSAVAMEFLETGEIFQTGTDPKPEKLPKFLALESPVALIGKDGIPRVIPDGEWAAYFRRHFFAACADVSRFAIRQWGSPEAAAGWEKTTLPYCRKLPGHELVEPLLATQPADYQSDLRATAEFLHHNPEKVPPGLCYDSRFPSLSIKSETSSKLDPHTRIIYRRGKRIGDLTVRSPIFASTWTWAAMPIETGQTFFASNATFPRR